MAKGRVINKSISTSKKVNLDLRNPLDILLYVLGLCHADDDGRLDGHATIYRSKVAPALPGLTDARVDLALSAMVNARLITRYTAEGVMVVQFLDWDIHQTFKGYQRKPSKLPPEPKEVKITLSGDNHPNLPIKETKLKESNIYNTTAQPKKQADSRVKIIIDYFFQSYQEKFRRKYMVTPKDPVLAKQLLTYGELDEIKLLIKKFLSLNDDFIKKAGYTFGVFFSQFNKLASQNNIDEDGDEALT